LHEIGLHSAVENQGVSEAFGRITNGITVSELEVAQPGGDGLGADPAV
jgi:hypothetical protein